MSNKEEKALRTMSDGKILLRLLKYMKGHVLTIVIAFILMVVAVVLDVCLPNIVIKIIEELTSKTSEFSKVLSLVILYGIVMLSVYVLQYIQSIMLQKMGQKVMYNIRQDVFVAIESLSIAQLYEIPVGKLVTRVTSDTNTLNEMYTTLIINLIRNILTIVATVVMMFLISVKLTLLVLSVVPFLIAASIVFR